MVKNRVTSRAWKARQRVSESDDTLVFGALAPEQPMAAILLAPLGITSRRLACLQTGKSKHSFQREVWREIGAPESFVPSGRT
jgi:hypothetical protein